MPSSEPLPWTSEPGRPTACPKFFLLKSEPLVFFFAGLGRRQKKERLKRESWREGERERGREGERERETEG